MHLKTLTLRGFKSFAGTTRLALEPGITCIVGPNGSGKSNVVDALSWVMGEQGAKNLRGGAMSDVIFAGTTQRAGLGRAEVTLTIDNSDGALPIDYAEVTISRTLFRGGGSEYAINGTACRLLDIQELLSDTGMGKQMHVIVGQGRLDEILTASPAERRGYIEEAAGVLKHRRRRERAARKLAGMAEKMTRLEDLTHEVRRQLGPLSRQAALARRASVIQATETDARLRLLADDIVAARERLASHDDSAHVWLRKREEIAALRERRATALQELDNQRKRQSPQLRALSALETEATTLVERYRATNMLLTERTRALLAQETTTTPPDLEALDAEVVRLEEADRQAQERVEESVDKRENERQGLSEALATQRELREQLQQLEGQALKAEKATAQLLAAVSAASAHTDATAAAVAAAENELKEAQARHTQAQSELAAAPALPAADDLSTQLDALRQQRDNANLEAAAAADQLRELEAKLTHSQARRDALAATLATLTTASTTAEIPELPVFASEIEIVSGWETAFAVILGDFASAIVWQDASEAAEWIGTLAAKEQTDAAKSAKEMRAFAVLAAADSTAVSAVEEPTPVGIWRATELATATDTRLGAALAELVADYYCAAELTDAQEFLKQQPRAKVVTRSGVFLTAHTVGKSGADNSAVHIQAAKSAAEKTLAQLSEEVAAAKEVASQVHAQATELTNEYEQLLAKIRVADRQRAEVAQQLGALRSQAEATAAEITRRERELHEAQTTQEKSLHELAAAKERLADAPTPPDPQELGELREKVAAAEAEVGTFQGRESDARVCEHQARDAARAAQHRARAARQAAAAGRAQLDQQRRAVAKRNARLKRLEELQKLATAAAEIATQTQTRLGERQQHVDAELNATNTQIDAARAELEHLDEEFREIVATTHRDEVARAELVLAVEQCVKQLDDQALGEDELLANYGPHVLVPAADPEQSPRPFNREELEKTVRQAQRELKRLGAINPLALEEHKAAQQRYDYLAGQLQDLKKSRADLQGLLHAIDKRVSEAFAAAFADTQEQFTHVFGTLFPGGTGRLILVDDPEGGDPGVEIEARPAGKKVKRLSLLSGGERSLAALAYVVAIFKARPSPFYVMDEVEAALDDANLGRILTLFEELRETSQLLIITHQKRTMEAADALYGVSMRDGVSAVVSQRLGDN